MKTFIVTAGSILLICGQAVGIANSSQVADSSVGKTPTFAMAAAVSGLDVTATWDSRIRSFRGKEASAVFFDGPPPRRRIVQKSQERQASFFYLYSDHNAQVNHLKPIGYMGDRQDVRIDEINLEDPADGLTCIKISYSPTKGRGEGWAGLYWIDAKSNWRAHQGTYNLSGMKRLTFWARGDKGGEQVAVFKVGGIGDKRAQKESASIGPVWLSNEWQQYAIDLTDIDLTRVSGGFAWSSDGSDNIGPLVFYLDEIRFER